VPQRKGGQITDLPTFYFSTGSGLVAELHMAQQ
jgi:hypothetical protein